MKGTLLVVLWLAFARGVAAQDVAARAGAPGTPPFGIGGMSSSAVGGASTHNLGNGVIGQSLKRGSVTTHTFSNRVTGTSYDYGSKTSSHFSNGVTGTTYRYGNTSTTRLSTGRTISCHTFGTITRCN